MSLVRGLWLIVACTATWQFASAATMKKAWPWPWPEGSAPTYSAQEVDPLKIFELQNKKEPSKTDQEVDPGGVLPPTQPTAPYNPPGGLFNRDKKGETDLPFIGGTRQTAVTLGRGFESDSLRAPAAQTACGSETMPFALLRSIVFYVRSKDGLACSVAVRNIQSLKETFGAESGTLRDPAYLSDDNHIVVRRMVESYVGDCSKTLQESAVTQLLGPDNTIRAAKNVGVLTTPTQRCMGSIVRGRILTAKHCVAIPDSDDGNHALIAPDSALEFETLSGEKYALSFDGADRSPLQESARDKDWIALGIKGGFQNSPATALAYDPGLADIWRPLVLISMSPYAMALRNDYRSSDKNAVIDISPICDILAKDGGYIFHACQTLAGMSGAPLMTIEGGRLTVVGVHTGDANAVDSSCARGIAHRFPNYGIVPPQNIGSEP